MTQAPIIRASLRSEAKTYVTDIPARDDVANMGGRAWRGRRGWLATGQ
jgi:hypothetical protein